MFPIQVVGPSDDGKEYDAEDAQLELDQGTPRCETLPCAVGAVLKVQHVSHAQSENTQVLYHAAAKERAVI